MKVFLLIYLLRVAYIVIFVPTYLL